MKKGAAPRAVREERAPRAADSAEPRESTASLWPENKLRHLALLWREYTSHPAARQADRWLSAYFREHKAYGKKDRAWYSESFFTCLRRALTFFPPGVVSNAAEAWLKIKATDTATLIRYCLEEPAKFDKTAATNELINAAGLPMTWATWLKASSLPQSDIGGFLTNLAARPPLYLRANFPEKEQEITDELRAAGFVVTATRHASGAVAFALKGPKPIYELPCVKNGLVEIQDFASQLIGEAVDAHPGMAVWDVCAGGGGKTMQIAAQMKNRGVLYASDIRDYKLDELKLRARKAGFHNVRRFVFDAEKAPEVTREIQNTGGFHRILVDAPCTASGTLRRNPDVRYRLMADDPEKFAGTQLKILSAAQQHLRPKGKLVYATCSVFKTENEAVVEKFLAAHADFKLVESKCSGSPQLDSDTMFYAIFERR